MIYLKIRNFFEINIIIKLFQASKSCVTLKERL